MKEIIILFALITILNDVNGSITEAPLNRMDVSGKRLRLMCNSNVTSSASNIHWDFKLYRGTKNTTYVRQRVVKSCVALSPDYDVESHSGGQCHLIIPSLKASLSGMYTCWNGKEAAVSAQVGTIITGPLYDIQPPGRVIEGQPIIINYRLRYSGHFKVNSSVDKAGISEYLTATESNTATEWTTDGQEYAVEGLHGRTEMNAPRAGGSQRYKETIVFNAVPQRPPLGNAGNLNNYQFSWDVSDFGIEYAPRSNEINITGDCRARFPVGSVITCSANAFPKASYSWTHPDGWVTQGPDVTLDKKGGSLQYTCNAENRVGKSMRHCNVNVGSSTAATAGSTSCLVNNGLSPLTRLVALILTTALISQLKSSFTPF